MSTPGACPASNHGAMTDPPKVSELLSRVARGDREATAHLASLLYGELRVLASSFLARERSGHTLQPTALVHEAYLRLVGRDNPWQNRHHFLAAAAVAMRRVLVDHARRRAAAKRGGDRDAVRLDTEGLAEERGDLQVLELDDLLRRLHELDPRKSKVVELKFFAGMTLDQIAGALGIARSTAAEDWTVARAWLASRLDPSP
mgnify:FL=1